MADLLPVTTADDITIRQLGTADWPALKAVRLAALADAPEAFASTLAREEGYTGERWQGWMSSTAGTFGAFAADGPAAAPAHLIRGVAAILVQAAREPAGSGGPAAGGAEWYLISMWVSPGLRGTGVAGRLVEAVCEHAAAGGADRIFLWVTDVNARAGAFYARLGFTPTGRRQLVRPEDPGHWETELARDLQRPGQPAS
jgi:GNAT superfamily N-acetyltransferase